MVKVRRVGVDKLWWIPSKMRLFNVRYFYSVLGRGGHGSDRGGFPPFSYPTRTPAGLEISTRYSSKLRPIRAGSGNAGRGGLGRVLRVVTGSGGLDCFLSFASSEKETKERTEGQDGKTHFLFYCRCYSENAARKSNFSLSLSQLPTFSQAPKLTFSLGLSCPSD